MLHMAYYGKSVMFRLFRPKFREIKRSIRSLIAPTLDSTSVKTAETSRPIPWTCRPITKTSSESDTMRLLYERIGRLSMLLEYPGGGRNEDVPRMLSEDASVTIPFKQYLNAGK